MCSFSNKLTTTQKADIATEIVILQREFSDSSIPSNLEKPVFPEKPKIIKEVESLVKFVKPLSCFFSSYSVLGRFSSKTCTRIV